MTEGEVQAEWELFARFKESGDRDVRNTLVERHRGLAVTLARRFQGRGEPMDDLVQVAMVGLVGAVDRFDPQLGNAFTTFATPTIVGELCRHFRDHTWAVKVPRGVKDLHLRVRSATADLHVELGRSPTVPELAHHLGTTDEKIIEALEASFAYRAESIHRSSTGGDGLGIEDRLVADDDPLHSFEVVETVRAMIARLPPQERTVMELRFHDGLTQAEIGRRIGVSQMHVSRVVRAALDRLGHTPGSETPEPDSPVP